MDDVPAEISADFARSFPDAAEVTWTVADGYALATFVTRQAPRLEGAVHSVTWYWLHDNSKKMHSAPIAFTDLPDAVTEAFYAGEYGSLTP